MVTVRQEMVGIHQEKSGNFPVVSCENSQTNVIIHQKIVGIHQEMVGIYQEIAGIRQEMAGIDQEKIRTFPAGILLPCSNVFPAFSCRNRPVLLDLGTSR
jgi:hypothetical protein